MRARSLYENSLIPSNEVPANEWSPNMVAEQCFAEHGRWTTTTPPPNAKAPRTSVN